MLILFAEDHSLVREALMLQLAGLAENVTFIEATSFDQAYEAIRPHRKPDLILLDFQMPGMDGARGIAKMSSRFPEIPVVILSGHSESRIIALTLEAGARGFIPKTASAATMLNALRLVLSGEKYIPPSLLDGDAQAERLKFETPRQMYPNEQVTRLSEREREILDQIIHGKTNPQIAEMFNISLSLANVYVRNIYKRLGVANRAAAVRTALRSS